MSSEQWEKAVEKHYSESASANLEYLDLAGTHKPKLSQLAHNIAVTHDRILLSSKVHLKHLKQIQEKQEVFERKLESIQRKLTRLQPKEVSDPLTFSDAEKLVTRLYEKPKEIEAQALQLTEELRVRVDKIEDLVKRVEAWLHS